jgi:hypothetical protein
MSNSIVFLDIDGVVCTLRSQFAFGDNTLMQAWDITCCQMIRRLCKKYDLRIVISSTWRNGKKEILAHYLVVFGLIDYIYDTRNSKNDIDMHLLDPSGVWKTPRVEGIRGNEIRAWLSANPEINHYVIVDDDSDFLPEQLPFLIQTEGQEGFSANNYMQMEDMIKKFETVRENL